MRSREVTLGSTRQPIIRGFLGVYFNIYIDFNKEDTSLLTLSATTRGSRIAGEISFPHISLNVCEAVCGLVCVKVD